MCTIYNLIISHININTDTILWLYNININKEI